MTDAVLDALLGDWAKRHTLSPALSETIRAAVLTVPPVTTTSLPADWWRGFAHTLSLTMRQASDSVRPGIIRPSLTR